jgi:hypothetical protein
MAKRTGYTELPLHYGKAPRWLFDLMKKLAREISIVIVEEFGPEDLLQKLSDPAWFQAFGCVLGFDWHSSGLTTTTLGALKDGLKGTENDLGIFIAGGKGKTSRKTPDQIEEFCNKYSISLPVQSPMSNVAAPLVYASKMAAKVDNTALQDGYQLYHHVFIFSKSGTWTVVQQGMNPDIHYARRYHWLSENVESFVNEPHKGIICDQKGKPLNMVAEESEKSRKASTELSHEKPEKLVSELKKAKSLVLPKHHEVLISGIHPDYIYKSLIKSHERNPKNFEELLSTEGVGPKAIRALALLSDLIFKAQPSFKDPAKYSFAHGGKDGHPYPVDRKTYQTSINVLHDVLNKAKIGHSDKMKAFERLKAFLV